MRWEKAHPDRTSSNSSEDWDLFIDEEEDIVGVVSHIKNGWRAISFVGHTNVSMHLTREEAQEAVIRDVVAWRIGQ